MEWNWEHWVALVVWTWVWDNFVSELWSELWAWATKWWK